MKNDVWFRERARELYHCEGALEVDDDAAVSIGASGGAYVQAWVWVDTIPEGAPGMET